MTPRDGTYTGPLARAGLTALIACALAAAGCGGQEGPKRYHVSGQVTWQGNPVPAGTVTFTPDVRKGNSGPQGAAPIRNGRYDTRDAGGRGTTGGPQIVSVRGFDGSPPTETDPLGRQLFAEHQAEHDLPKENTTLDLAVPAAPPGRP